jgi:O-antigen ligase
MMIAVLVMFLEGPWINPSLFQASPFVLAMSWAAAFLVRPFHLQGASVLIPLSATVAWGLFQLAAGRTVNPWNTGMSVVAWAGNLAACFLALQTTGSRETRGRFLDALLYFAFGLSIVSVVQYFGWNGRIFFLYPVSGFAVLGPFRNRDHYAAFVEMILPLALVRASIAGPRTMRFVVIAATLFATVIAGASRAGALLMTAEVIVVPLAVWRKGDSAIAHRRAGVTRLWLLIFVFVSVVGWAVLWERFRVPDPFRGRRELLQDTIAMVRARPCFGVGLGNFQTVFPAYQSVDFGSPVLHTHNDWVEWAADGGIPFSLLLAAIAIWTIPKAFRTPWGLGLIAAMAHSLVDYPLQLPVLQLWFFALLGVLTAETRDVGTAPRGQSGAAA